MLQQILGGVVILFFLFRLFQQKKRHQISGSEFLLWLVFWLLALGAVIFIRQIDALVAWLGFSGTAINILLYIVVLALIYQVFRMRLALARLEKDLSAINQELSLRK